MNCSKRILFLSAEDFKEKSIQVIKLTPEAYRDNGWQVNYIVGRDNSNKGNYFYETPIDIRGIDIERFSIPFGGIVNTVDNSIILAFINRIRRFLTIAILFFKGLKFLRKNKVDIVYGYEPLGFIAARLLKLCGITQKAKIIARFQGVLYIKEHLRRGDKFRYISNFDVYYALRTKSDLCILTNDGSQGLDVLSKLKSKHLQNEVKFFVNGVDKISLSEDQVCDFIKNNAIYSQNGSLKLISISRIDDHKRLDRGIKILDHIVNVNNYHNVKYIILGDGTEMSSMMDLVNQKKLNEYVIFTGAIKHDLIKYHLQLADIFISMYTSTNVGNPLLEAIRANKIIFTLDNGDTNYWIQHKTNGFIYPVDDDKDLDSSDYKKIAADIIEIWNNKERLSQIRREIKKTEEEKLWTWDQRFAAELEAVNNILVKVKV